jgi:hypothetical protein
MANLLSRVLAGCCGCGLEPAAVAVGADPDAPDETYGARCWADTTRWAVTRPAHIHLDGHAHSRECEA